MADVSKRLTMGIFTNEISDLYTVASGKKTFIKAVTFCNPTPTDLKFSFVINGHGMIWNHTIKGNDTITVPFLDQIIHEGEKLTGRSDVAVQGVLYYISGREVDV